MAIVDPGPGNSWPPITPGFLKERLRSGNRVRTRVTREARTMGYDPCTDNTVATFHSHVEVNGREYAKLKLPSGAWLKISYEHLVEIIQLDYDYRKAQLIDHAATEAAPK